MPNLLHRLCAAAIGIPLSLSFNMAAFAQATTHPTSIFPVEKALRATDVTLVSGRKIQVLQSQRLRTAEGIPVVTFAFKCDYSLDDSENLNKLIGEIWASLQAEVERSNAEGFVIAAINLKDGPITKENARNFVFKKDVLGTWVCPTNPSLTKQADMYMELYGALKKQDWEKSQKILTELVKIWPNSAQCYMNLGTSFMQKDQFQSAITQFDKAIELDPDCAMCFNNRGIAHRKAGDNEKAAADWNHAISLNPKLAMAYMNRGAMNVRDKKYAEALPDLEKAIELEPNGESYWWRGTALKNLHQGDEGKADLERAARMGFKEGSDTFTLKEQQ